MAFIATLLHVRLISSALNIRLPVDTTGVLKWAIGADNYTANVALDGTISGHAVLGQVIDQKVILKPNLLIPVSTQINFEYTAFTSASINTGNKPDCWQVRELKYRVRHIRCINSRLIW